MSEVTINGVDKAVVECHKAQLQSSGVPQHLWSTLFRKLIGQIYDAGGSFQLCQLTYTNGEREVDDPLWQVVVTRQQGIKANDPENIFLIDHAWTYHANEARQCLSDIPGLLERMVALMDLPSDHDDRDLFIDAVLREMWKFNSTYSLAGKTAEDSLPVWYIMDEFGSRIQHCGEPNFRIVPFYFTPHKCCYSLLFPCQDVEEGEEVTRNYVETGAVDSLTRDAQMLPWFPLSLTHVDPTQDEPSQEFFKAGRVNENMPDPDAPVQPLPSDRPIKVYTEYEYVREYLTDPRFQITANREEADILWCIEHFKDYKGLRERPERRVNQYPGEHVITVKDLLAVVCRRRISGQSSLSHMEENEEEKRDEEGESKEEKPFPPWLPLTYCLKRELVKFVSLFQRREERHADNHWIIKPWNLARGLDHTISCNLNHILRLPSTGPKIAQKYISDPVLFHREDIEADVKFDVRYIVMLLSVSPLKVAVYRRFWIRFANMAFDLTQLDNSHKHNTVNNYNDTFLLQMYCHEFISKFNQQYPDQPWEVAEKLIYDMMYQVFVCSASQPYPSGLSHNLQCKGFYGFDIMLDWSLKDGKRVMQPQLLEVNFNPDCKRACEYYPEFYNDVFAVMFLEETDGHNVALLQDS